MQIAILLYDRFTALDAVGPYDVLGRLPGADLAFVAVEPGPVRTEQRTLALTADKALSEVPRPDIVMVPGGFGTRYLLDDEAILGWLREAHEHSKWTTSVCTGSLLLAAAGVSSGIDMALHLVALEAGEMAAQAIQLGIEYDPQPPFDAGSPEKAPAEVVEFMRTVGVQNA